MISEEDDDLEPVGGQNEVTLNTEMSNKHKFYVCPYRGICSFSTSDVQAYVNHISECGANNEKTSIPCVYCPRPTDFTTIDLLVEHLREDHLRMNNIYHCPLDRFSADDTDILNKHCQRLHAAVNGPLQCYNCLQTVTTFDELTAHYLSNTYILEQCAICLFESDSGGNALREHFRSVHPTEPRVYSSFFKCLICLTNLDAFVKMTTRSEEKEEETKPKLAETKVEKKVVAAPKAASLQSYCYVPRRGVKRFRCGFGENCTFRETSSVLEQRRHVLEIHVKNKCAQCSVCQFSTMNPFRGRRHNRIHKVKIVKKLKPHHRYALVRDLNYLSCKPLPPPRSPKYKCLKCGFCCQTWTPYTMRHHVLRTHRSGADMSISAPHGSLVFQVPPLKSELRESEKVELKEATASSSVELAVGCVPDAKADHLNSHLLGGKVKKSVTDELEEPVITVRDTNLNKASNGEALPAPHKKAERYTPKRRRVRKYQCAVEGKCDFKGTSSVHKQRRHVLNEHIMDNYSLCSKCNLISRNARRVLLHQQKKTDHTFTDKKFLNACALYKFDPDANLLSFKKLRRSRWPRYQCTKCRCYLRSLSSFRMRAHLMKSHRSCRSLTVKKSGWTQMRFSVRMNKHLLAAWKKLKGFEDKEVETTRSSLLKEAGVPASIKFPRLISVLPNSSEKGPLVIPNRKGGKRKSQLDEKSSSVPSILAKKARKHPDMSGEKGTDRARDSAATTHAIGKQQYTVTSASSTRDRVHLVSVSALEESPTAKSSLRDPRRKRSAATKAQMLTDNRSSVDESQVKPAATTNVQSLTKKKKEFQVPAARLEKESTLSHAIKSSVPADVQQKPSAPKGKLSMGRKKGSSGSSLDFVQVSTAPSQKVVPGPKRQSPTPPTRKINTIAFNGPQMKTPTPVTRKDTTNKSSVPLPQNRTPAAPIRKDNTTSHSNVIIRPSKEAKKLAQKAQRLRKLSGDPSKSTDKDVTSTKLPTTTTADPSQKDVNGITSATKAVDPTLEEAKNSQIQKLGSLIDLQEKHRRDLRTLPSLDELQAPLNRQPVRDKAPRHHNKAKKTPTKKAPVPPQPTIVGSLTEYGNNTAVARTGIHGGHSATLIEGKPRRVVTGKSIVRDMAKKVATTKLVDPRKRPPESSGKVSQTNVDHSVTPIKLNILPRLPTPKMPKKDVPQHRIMESTAEPILQRQAAVGSLSKKTTELADPRKKPPVQKLAAVTLQQNVQPLMSMDPPPGLQLQSNYIPPTNVCPGEVGNTIVLVPASYFLGTDALVPPNLPLAIPTGTVIPTPTPKPISVVTTGITDDKATVQKDDQFCSPPDDIEISADETELQQRSIPVVISSHDVIDLTGDDDIDKEKQGKIPSHSPVNPEVADLLERPFKNLTEEQLSERLASLKSEINKMKDRKSITSRADDSKKQAIPHSLETKKPEPVTAKKVANEDTVVDHSSTADTARHSDMSIEQLKEQFVRNYEELQKKKAEELEVAEMRMRQTAINSLKITEEKKHRTAKRSMKTTEKEKPKTTTPHSLKATGKVERQQTDRNSLGNTEEKKRVPTVSSSLKTNNDEQLHLTRSSGNNLTHVEHGHQRNRHVPSDIKDKQKLLSCMNNVLNEIKVKKQKGYKVPPPCKRSRKTFEEGLHGLFDLTKNSPATEKRCTSVQSANASSSKVGENPNTNVLDWLLHLKELPIDDDNNSSMFHPPIISPGDPAPPLSSLIKSPVISVPTVVEKESVSLPTSDIDDIEQKRAVVNDGLGELEYSNHDSPLMERTVAKNGTFNFSATVVEENESLSSTLDHPPIISESASSAPPEFVDITPAALYSPISQLDVDERTSIEEGEIASSVEEDLNYGHEVLMLQSNFQEQSIDASEKSVESDPPVSALVSEHVETLPVANVETPEVLEATKSSTEETDGTKLPASNQIQSISFDIKPKKKSHPILPDEVVLSMALKDMGNAVIEVDDKKDSGTISKVRRNKLLLNFNDKELAILGKRVKKAIQQIQCDGGLPGLLKQLEIPFPLLSKTVNITNLGIRQRLIVEAAGTVAKFFAIRNTNLCKVTFATGAEALVAVIMFDGKLSNDGKVMRAVIDDSEVPMSSIESPKQVETMAVVIQGFSKKPPEEKLIDILQTANISELGKFDIGLHKGSWCAVVRLSEENANSVVLSMDGLSFMGSQLTAQVDHSFRF